MIKKRAFNRKLFVFIILALAIILIAPLAFVFNSISSYADFSELHGEINITVNNKNGGVSPESVAAYNGGQITTYKWRNSRTMNVSFVHDGEYLPPNNNANESVYTMNINVEFLKGYPDSVFENYTTKENVFTREDLTPETIDNQVFSFSIDEGFSSENSDVEIKGWGIYRFKIIVNGAEKYSDYIFIAPDYQVTSHPNMDYNIVHSSNSMHDSFDFYLVNEASFKYIDTNYLKWYVTGENVAGITYVLIEDDLKEERFSNYDECLYKKGAINRTGTRFHFNDNEIAGKWTVWCEFENRNDGSTSIVQSANIIELQTSQNVRLTWVIWIVLGVSVVAICGVAGIAIYRSKKEKVW